MFRRSGLCCERAQRLFFDGLRQLFTNSVPMLRMRRDLNHFLCSNHVTRFKKEECMSLTAHLDQLKKKHQTLSEAVEQEQRAPGANDIKIADLKKQKLRIKEEITRLSA